MRSILRAIPRSSLAVALAAASALAASGPVDPALYKDLVWRPIGPFRGGRVLAVAGIPGDPVTYYFGAVGGGVWKTTNAGRVWKPIFDETGVASIGAIAVAPSDANVLYVGTGEADMRSDIGFGAGVYKSTDAGRSWAFTGLRDTIHIGRILVDPRDSNVVLVAALGHAYRPNEERGVFRSEDGGKTWRKTLYKGADTGAIDLAYAPGDARTVYAALWQTRRPPWNAYPPTDGPGGGLYRSTDGGATWAPLAGSGLPSGAIGRAGFATAPPGAAHRIYALIDAKDSRQAGLYRSDDAGSSWRLVGTDRRIIDRGWYFSHVIADPKDPDTVWVANVSLYRSRDGGSTFTAIKGAPGGDDYHALWIDPGDTRRMILGCDQGAAVSLDGGETWSSWYNQPTGQFYHVATDGHFPYRVYGAQQDSGTASVSSRSDYGQITFRDWQPVGAEESGCIVPDPKDPDVVYGGGPGGQVFRFSRPTGQSEDVSPWPVPSWGLQPPEMKYRFTWTSPLAFSSDGGVLYLGSQKLLRTSDRGKSWSEASPDLTLSDGVPKSDPGYGRGVIYAIAPSPISKDLIWVGTDNGLIQRTEDGGKTWRNVTPAGLPAWSKIGILEASRYDAATAIAAVDRHRLDDYAPYIYRTHDGGKTWSRITDGIAAPAFVNAVREDPVRRGLLYAATERGVFVSFDDGGRWQPLQQNLPPASVRDLAVEGNDLVAATHGRAFWILDDVTPLRQIEPGGTTFEARLLAPAAALRLRGNVANDTPFPPETATAPNPPEGAVIDYVLPRPAPADVLLEIRDGRGKLVRSFSSRTEPEAPAEPLPFPGFWLKTPKTLAASPGHNRFVWNLRYADPKVLRPDYGIAATVWDGVPLMPRGRLVLPGQYEVRLTAGGQTLTQPLTVKPDPRLAATAEDLRRQFDLLEKIGEALDKTTAFVAEIRGVRTQLARLAPAPPGGASTAITEAALKLDAGAGSIEGVTDAGGRRASGLAGLDGELAHLARAVDNADASPTAQQQAAWEEERRELDGAQARWKELREGDLAALNAKLRQAGKPAIEAGSK